jgi:hypothetical protein
MDELRRPSARTSSPGWRGRAGPDGAPVDEKLIEANPFEVPESMVRLQAIMMLQGMSRRLSAQGVRLQDVYPDAEA